MSKLQESRVRSLAHLLPLTVRCSDCRNLFGDINTYRTPCDAPSAADAAGHIELVIPRSKLMRKPLAIPAPDAWPKIAAMNLCKIGTEAAVPAAHAFGGFQAQIGH